MHTVLIISIVALLAISIGAFAIGAEKSWKLVLSSLAIAFIEGIGIFLLGITQSNDKAVTVLIPAFISGSLIIIGAFMLLMVSVFCQNRDQEEPLQSP